MDTDQHGWQQPDQPDCACARTLIYLIGARGRQITTTQRRGRSDASGWNNGILEKWNNGSGSTCGQIKNHKSKITKKSQISNHKKDPRLPETPTSKSQIPMNSNSNSNEMGGKEEKRVLNHKSQHPNHNEITKHNDSTTDGSALVVI
jgi:hypothetical protein